MDFPDLKEELERKTSETLAETLQHLSEGRSTPETAMAVLRSLWGTTAGLVSKELMNMIAEATDTVDQETDWVGAEPRRRMFRKGDSLVIIEVPNEYESTTMMMQGVISKTIKVTDHDMTLNEALDRHNKTVSMLTSKGYRE